MSNIHFPGYKDDPKAFWEQTDRAYAHLDTIDHEALWADWEKAFIPRYDWTGKIVIDYGCGGGWLGKLLFEKYGIAEYWGVDISDRSLEFARGNVPKGRFYDPTGYVLPISARLGYADSPPTDKVVFVCLNVLHHLPTIHMVKEVTDRLATWHTLVDHFIMTIRNCGKPTFFQPDNPGNAFWTEPQFMRGLMAEDWELQWKSAIEPAPACRQYLGFKRVWE